MDKEATANAYFYNYPPKRDASLAFEDQKRPKIPHIKDNSDTARLREMYEEMMDIMKRNFEADLSAAKKSMGNEIESLQEMLSRNSRELLAKVHEYQELDKKFKLYFIKSDKYISDREEKLQEIQEECDRLAGEYGRYDSMLVEERAKNAKLEVQMAEMAVSHEALLKLSKKQRFEIKDYERRYQAIDIAKLHEQVEFYKNQVEKA